MSNTCGVDMVDAATKLIMNTGLIACAIKIKQPQNTLNTLASYTK